MPQDRPVLQHLLIKTNRTCKVLVYNHVWYQQNPSSNPSSVSYKSPSFAVSVLGFHFTDNFFYSWFKFDGHSLFLWIKQNLNEDILAKFCTWHTRSLCKICRSSAPGWQQKGLTGKWSICRSCWNGNNLWELHWFLLLRHAILICRTCNLNIFAGPRACMAFSVFADTVRVQKYEGISSEWYDAWKLNCSKNNFHWIWIMNQNHF